MQLIVLGDLHRRAEHVLDGLRKGLTHIAAVGQHARTIVLLAAYRATSVRPEAFVLSRRFLTIEPYGIVLRHDDAALIAILNAEITRMMRADEFRRHYETWFQQPIPGRKVNLNLPMNEMLRAQIASPSQVLPSTY